MDIGLIDLPKSEWGPTTGRQVILKDDFLDIEQGLLQILGLQGVPATAWVDATSIKVPATADDIAAVMLSGFPSVLHPGRFVSGGLTDGRYREITANVIMDFDLAANFWGNEKASQWYAIYGVAGNAATAFTLKGMPWMRVKTQAGQVISLGTLGAPATGIGYGFPTDSLVGYLIYFASGASKGLLRTISANNNNDSNAGTITYSGPAVSVTQGDWFIILPATNFRLIGEIFNNSAGNIQNFLDTGNFIQWNADISLAHADGANEDIQICSPLAREARVTLWDSVASGSIAYVGNGSISSGYSVINAGGPSGGSGTRVQSMGTLDITLQACQYSCVSAYSLKAVGYRKVY